MKKLLISVLLIGMSAAPVYAAPYVSGSFGLGLLGNADVTSAGVTDKAGQTFKTGIPFGGAIGFKNNGYRVEAALGFQNQKVDTWQHAPDPTNDSVSMLTYMANGYYDVDINNASLSPYLMAGLGGARVNSKNEGMADHKSTVFAWQAGVGVGIKAADNLTVDLGYRYLNPSKFKDSYGEYTTSSSNFLAGIRYEFH